MKTLGIVGIGRVGSALAYALCRADLPLAAIANRCNQKARSLATTLEETFGVGPTVVEVGKVSTLADVIFICTPDDSISEACSAMKWGPDKLAVHCSGARTLHPLSSARLAGATIGSFHPLNSFPVCDPGSQSTLHAAADNLRTSWVAVSALDSDTSCLLGSLADLVGAGHFSVPDEMRGLYHAAAVFSSNFVVTLMASASALWVKMGYSEEEVMRFTGPLLRATCNNLLKFGPRAALTGPIARGDVGTISRHLESLAGTKGDLGDVGQLYRAMSRSTIPLALAKGTLEPAAAEMIRRTLDTMDKERFKSCERC